MLSIVSKTPTLSLRLRKSPRAEPMDNTNNNNYFVLFLKNKLIFNFDKKIESLMHNI
jgi:hypothetical protein